MKQLLIRADDLGYSRAVDLGLARTVLEGLVRSVGLMPNMPEAEHGWSLIKDADVAIGQHTNVCLGTPCAGPQEIPSLIAENGQFKSSRTYRSAFAAGEDFVMYDEAVREAEAQLTQFREIIGRDPDYFEAHAVLSPNLNRAIEDVASKHGLRYQPASFDPTATVTCGNTSVRMVMRSMGEAYDPAQTIKDAVSAMHDGEAVVFVGHPGYLDQFILESSSLTFPRTKEVDALISSDLAEWLYAQENLVLVDYRDL